MGFRTAPLFAGACGPDLHVHNGACGLPCPPPYAPGLSSGARPASTRSFRATRAGVRTPARTPFESDTRLARFAHASAARPDPFSPRVALDKTVVGLPAEELADLALRVEPRSSARRDQLLHVVPAGVGDEAGEVVDGGKVHWRRSSTYAPTARRSLARLRARAAAIRGPWTSNGTPEASWRIPGYWDAARKCKAPRAEETIMGAFGRPL